MKKSLFITLLALSTLQISGEMNAMKRDVNDPTREGQEPNTTRQREDVAAVAPAAATPVATAAAGVTNRCGICMGDFDTQDETGHVIKQIELPCCKYAICEGCLETCLRRNGTCPQCKEPIGNIKQIKDPVIKAMLTRKIHSKREQELKEKATAQEAAKKQAEDERIQNQISRFASGEDITAYVDVPADTIIEVNIAYTSTDRQYRFQVATRLPILHFLARGGANQHAEYNDAFELVKYFVEEKGADINQKVTILLNLSQNPYEMDCATTYADMVVSIQNLKSFPPIYKRTYAMHLHDLTPLEIAEATGNHNIAEYLRGKLAEAESAKSLLSKVLSKLNPFKK